MKLKNRIVGSTVYEIVTVTKVLFWSTCNLLNMRITVMTLPAFEKIFPGTFCV